MSGKKESKKIELTLVKSLIGRLPKHIHIAKQLRLTKIGKVAVHEDIPAIRGLVNQVEYLLSVKEQL